MKFLLNNSFQNYHSVDTMGKWCYEVYLRFGTHSDYLNILTNCSLKLENPTGLGSAKIYVFTNVEFKVQWKLTLTSMFNVRKTVIGPNMMDQVDSFSLSDVVYLTFEVTNVLSLIQTFIFYNFLRYACSEPINYPNEIFTSNKVFTPTYSHHQSHCMISFLGYKENDTIHLDIWPVYINEIAFKPQPIQIAKSMKSCSDICIWTVSMQRIVRGSNNSEEMLFTKQSMFTWQEYYDPQPLKLIINKENCINCTLEFKIQKMQTTSTTSKVNRPVDDHNEIR